jgi:hypothetical protein
MNINNNSAKNTQDFNCAMGYRDTIFFKTSDLEYLLIVGVVITAIFCLCASIPAEIQPALILGGAMTLLQYLILLCVRFYRRTRSVNYPPQEIALYAGNLDEITLALYGSGLNLKNKIGEYYIFTTNYRILSNSEFVVREIERFCKVQANPALVRELKKYIELVPLENKSIEGYSNTADNAA